MQFGASSKLGIEVMRPSVLSILVCCGFQGSQAETLNLSATKLFCFLAKLDPNQGMFRDSNGASPTPEKNSSKNKLGEAPFVLSLHFFRILNVYIRLFYEPKHDAC